MVRGIDYNEGGEPDLGYTGVDMSWREDGERKFKVFNTGDFVKDWMHALKWFIEGDFGEHLVNSSSVDHFIMDGAPFDSAYIGFNENKEPYLYYEWDDRGLEVFVPKGMRPTWEELKIMCQ